MRGGKGKERGKKKRKRKGKGTATLTSCAPSIPLNPGYTVVTNSEFHSKRGEGTDKHCHCQLIPAFTRNSSGDEIANVNFLYDIVHALKIQ